MNQFVLQRGAGVHGNGVCARCFPTSGGGGKHVCGEQNFDLIFQ